MTETLADRAWGELDSIVKDVDEGCLSTEPPEGAEVYIIEQFRLIKEMVEATRQRNLEKLKAVVAEDALVFSYTHFVRKAIKMIEGSQE